MLEEFSNAALTWIAANPGWVGLVIFLTAMSESLVVVGLIVPGAAMMFGFGALIALGHVAFWPACAWAVAGAVAGDWLSFWVGRIFHQRLRKVWPFSRHPQMLNRGEEFFRRHGGKSVLFGRFFGPVRAVIPAVAGMLDMPSSRFLLVNLSSALLWAPAYLFPGMVFGASLELASQIAWRLVVLIMLMIGLLWLTISTVRVAFQLLQPRVNGWLQAYYVWSRHRPIIGPVSASLLDPREGEIRGLATVAMLLVGLGSSALLLLFATGRQLPTALDKSLYYFLQDLRTPWADRLMTFLTELGDYQVYLPLTAAVFAWLYWKRARSAALHWLAAVGFGLITANLFKWMFKIPRPIDIYEGVSSYSFPSSHALLSTVLFGFLAVLIARETSPRWRWAPYLGAALIAIPIAFSRLYLGAHWLSDTLAGVSLGLAWVVVLGIAYNRHLAPPIGRQKLLLVSLLAVIVSDLPHAALHYQDDLSRYRVRHEITRMARHVWWNSGWRHQPAYRVDFQGRRKQSMELQWAVTRDELERRLLSTGWQPAPPSTPASAMRMLSPKATIAELPVLPRVHDGQHEALTFVRAGPLPETRWTLRLWDSRNRLQPGGIPLWLGSLGLQHLQRRLSFISFAAYRPHPAGSTRELLGSALAELPMRTAKRGTGNGSEVLLVGAPPPPNALATPPDRAKPGPP